MRNEIRQVTAVQVTVNNIRDQQLTNFSKFSPRPLIKHDSFSKTAARIELIFAEFIDLVTQIMLSKNDDGCLNHCGYFDGQRSK